MTSLQDPILVYGAGLAGHLATASLANGLGKSRPVVQICPPDHTEADAFYGGSTAPTAYNFLLGLGLSEPTLLLKSATSFSLGTQFRRWLNSRSWMQCHHSPLSTPEGIPMRHVLARLGLPLEPLLISAQVALAGRFAHPPTDPNSILSRAEYGYQFSAQEWTALLNQHLRASPARRIETAIATIEASDGVIRAITLETGETLNPCLVVDASGPSREAVLAAGGVYSSSRRVTAHAQITPTTQLGPACRIVDATATGWTASTFLQGAEHRLTVGSPQDGAPGAGFEIAPGALNAAWVGNCVAIGQACAVIEPLTPAPMMMLQRDIERLLELIPTSAGMDVERAEFNRRYREDVAHLNLFQSPILSADNAPDTAYWRDIGAQEDDPRLERKLAQFGHRGILVNYDLEPFNEEDWTILHLGQGRTPRIYDRQADQISEQDARRTLGQIKAMIDQVVPRMPPHHLYMTKLKQYLEKQNHG